MLLKEESKYLGDGHHNLKAIVNLYLKNYNEDKIVGCEVAASEVLATIAVPRKLLQCR